MGRCLFSQQHNFEGHNKICASSSLALVPAWITETIPVTVLEREHGRPALAEALKRRVLLAGLFYHYRSKTGL